MQKWEYCSIVAAYISTPPDRADAIVAALESKLDSESKIQVIKHDKGDWSIDAAYVLTMQTGKKTPVESAGATLAELGSGGWELVTVIQDEPLKNVSMRTYYLKRAVAS